MPTAEQEDLFIIEALLFASPHPLTQKHVNQIFENDPPRLTSVIEILRKKAAERSFQLSNNVAEFLIRRSNRDLNSLIEILDEIDRSSLAAKRKVTIPFIKELIS